MMDGRIISIVVLLSLNLIVAIIYLIVGMVKGTDRKKTLIYFILTVLVPVFFIIFMLATMLFRWVTRLLRLDLSDVVFAKDKIKPLERGDEDAENNLVPIEEALSVTDTQSLRTFMLDILKGDVSGYLTKLKEALVSDDSETAHYAATVLREELNSFRSTVYSSFSAIEHSKKSEDRDNLSIVVIRYMNEYLSKDLFSEDETRDYAVKLADIADGVFESNYRMLSVDDFYGICMSLLKSGVYDRCRQWCYLFGDIYPNTQERYMTWISYCFETGRRKEFTKALNELMTSGIPVDQETISHIRTFRQEKSNGNS